MHCEVTRDRLRAVRSTHPSFCGSVSGKVAAWQESPGIPKTVRVPTRSGSTSTHGYMDRATHSANKRAVCLKPGGSRSSVAQIVISEPHFRAELQLAARQRLFIHAIGDAALRVRLRIRGERAAA